MLLIFSLENLDELFVLFCVYLCDLFIVIRIALIYLRDHFIQVFFQVIILFHLFFQSILIVSGNFFFFALELLQYLFFLQGVVLGFILHLFDLVLRFLQDPIEVGHFPVASVSNLIDFIALVQFK